MNTYPLLLLLLPPLLLLLLLLRPVRTAQGQWCPWTFDGCKTNYFGTGCEAWEVRPCNCGVWNETQAADGTRCGFRRQVSRAAWRPQLSLRHCSRGPPPCKIVARMCKWTSWSGPSATCGLVTIRRRRDVCCHPVTMRPIESPQLCQAADGFNSMEEMRWLAPCPSTVSTEAATTAQQPQPTWPTLPKKRPQRQLLDGEGPVLVAALATLLVFLLILTVVFLIILRLRCRGEDPQSAEAAQNRNEAGQRLTETLRRPRSPPSYDMATRLSRTPLTKREAEAEETGLRV